MPGIQLKPWIRFAVTLLLMAVVVLLPSACQPQQPPPTPPPGPPTSKLGTVEYDITYATINGVTLKLDIHYPETATSPVPAVLWVHGGGWTSGDKRTGAGTPYIPELVSRGYLVASINYRLAPDYKITDQIADVKCAVRFLRAKSSEYGIDSGRIGAFGSSAGGHLVALLGTSDAGAGLEGTGGYAERSSRVQAVVDLFGPAEFSRMFRLAGAQQLQRLFGVGDLASEVITSLSPVTHVTADDPPFLILHGDQDQVVPLEQSEALLSSLQQAGVPATLVVVKNAGHGFQPTPASAAISPTQADLARMVADFFDENLKGPGHAGK